MRRPSSRTQSALDAASLSRTTAAKLSVQMIRAFADQGKDPVAPRLTASVVGVAGLGQRPQCVVGESFYN